MNIIPRWLRKRVYREDAIKRMSKEIQSLSEQCYYAKSIQKKLEKQIEALTYDPKGASAEAFEQKYLSALTFIFASSNFDAYQQFLRLTEGHDYREDIKKYAIKIKIG